MKGRRGIENLLIGCGSRMRGLVCRRRRGVICMVVQLVVDVLDVRLRVRVERGRGGAVRGRRVRGAVLGRVRCGLRLLVLLCGLVLLA